MQHPKVKMSNFSHGETKLLIKLWGSNFVQNKLILTNETMSVMRILSRNLAFCGYFRTPKQIDLHLKNLKYLYNRIKQTKLMGEELTKEDLDWPYYKLIDEIAIKQRLRRMKKSKLGKMKVKNEIVNEGIDIT